MNSQTQGAIDLHSHTTVSDGSLTPEELMQEAMSRGLSAIAVTDHDQLAAIARCRTVAQGSALEVIAGVEISSSHEDSTLHLLGLFVDPQHAGLNAYLQELFEERKLRAAKMIAKLQGLGMTITLDDILQEGKGAAVGRNHVAKMLLKKGLVRSRKEAFDRFLKKGCPAYVPYERSAPREALDKIRDAGGRSFLAHPVLVRDQNLISTLIGWGLSGLEVVHPEHSAGQVKHYSDLCDRHRLLKSGGSDYHGPNMERKGDLGCMNVPREYLEKIRASL